MTGKHYALKISLVYLTFGLLWILFSDVFVWFSSLNKDVITYLSIIKGGIYVGLSAVLIYIISNRYIRNLSQANQHLQNSYDELTAANEELTANEEELRQQFTEIMQANTKINTQNAILSTLQETTAGLLNQLDANTLLNVIIRNATELAETPHGFIALVDKKKAFIQLKVGLGIFQDQQESFKTIPEFGQIGQFLHSGQAQLIENYATWEDRLNYAFLDKVHSIIQVPLKINQEVVGTIGLVHTEPDRSFSADHVESLKRFAAMASIALNNAQLLAQVHQELSEHQKKEATLRAIFNATNDAILLHDVESTEMLNLNHKAVELFGYTLTEMQHMGTAKFDVLHCNGLLQEMIINSPHEGSQLLEWSATNKRGQLLYLETNLRRALIEEKECVLSVIRDISERKKAKAELARTQTQKLALMNAIPDLMLLINKEGTFLDHNHPAGFEPIVPPREFLGKSISDIFPSDIAQNTIYHIQQAINSNTIQLFEYQLLQNNELHYFEARLVKASPNEVLAIIRDITYKKHMENQLEYLSLHDSLTKVYNRTYFEEEILKVHSRKDKSAGVISCDVDGLKLINDTLGHHAGDELLQVVAKILHSHAAPDVVARIGGDEFAVLVFEPDQQKMTDLYTAIKSAVKNYNNLNPQLPLSLSIGWAADFTTSDNIDALCKEADYNMYREKMHQGLSSRSAIVQAMMQALEARDYITEGHAERLQTIVEELAHKLQLPAPTIADLRLLAKFHDIGKVGIPDNILFKPDRLTSDEFAVMRRHCEIGFRIAKSAPDLEPIAEWILKHQEWWNGQGYPLGLAGEDIPLECRILALVDAFDAMTNDRPYRKALSRTAAIEELRKCAGTQFDPRLTEVFIDILLEKEK